MVSDPWGWEYADWGSPFASIVIVTCRACLARAADTWPMMVYTVWARSGCPGGYLVTNQNSVKLYVLAERLDHVHH